MADKNTYIPASNVWEEIVKNTEKATPGVDKGITGSGGATSVIKGDNNGVDAYGLYVQRICNGNSGVITDKSMQHNIDTVRACINSDDIIINEHKMNSYLYEITNMKKMQNTAIGNFTVSGTVLVKTYDHNLKKWVLIRRQVRVPMFSNLLDPYIIDERLNIEDSGETIYQYKINKDKNEGDK